MPRTLYQKIREIWKDKPDESTPILAKDLMHIEQGIYDNSNNMALKEIYNDTCIQLQPFPGNEKGSFSAAIGIDSKATAQNAVAIGNSSTASGSPSFASGAQVEASGSCSFATGYQTKSKGTQSVAMGVYSEASGTSSFAVGIEVKASGAYQFVHGKYNVNDPNSTYAHIVGGGTSDSNRKNIHTLDWEGNAYYSGDVENGNGVTMNGLMSKIEDLEQRIEKLEKEE